MYSILVAGSSGCGKTSLVNRFVGEKFQKEHEPTQHMNSTSHTVEVNGKTVRIMLVVLQDDQVYDFHQVRYSICIAMMFQNDTDGDRKYERFSINYYSTMDATVIMYDISNQESLETASDICERWKRYNQQNEKAVVILVGNKSDMKREINKQDAEDFAERENLPYTETSAKTNQNVTEMFMSVIKRLTENGDDDGCDVPADDMFALRKGYSCMSWDTDTAPTTTTQNSACSCVIN
ncbi:ras-related protein Rab-30-like isoform X1 [Mytilus edulis]|uniref:ras-related protein Rab-30-like isoform X1 n=1 Tax=Mytilus edulis TaxID=6550 RepID=UPI0039F042FF